MKINLGTRKHGYHEVSDVNSQLLNYLENVSVKYEGEFVEKNKQLALDFLAGRDLKKYVTLAGTVMLASIAILGLADPSLALANTGDMAVNGYIDTSPLDTFFKEVYWSMFRVLMYISTPVWAWVGIILATGGANEGKRTQAKKVGLGLIVGTGVTASAPWVTKQLFNLWKLIF